MTHQLDFHVTLWSNDAEALLLIEKRLKELEDVSNNKVRIGTYLDIINTAAIDADFTDINVHSVDINWDDEKETDEWLLEGKPVEVQFYQDLFDQIDAAQDYWELGYDVEEED
jgi:hypothetical protein